MSVQAKVELSGDFFRNDPGKTLQANVERMLDNLGDEMEGAVRQEIRSHAGAMPAWTGWTESHALGYTRSPKTGASWRFWAAVGIPTSGMDRRAAVRTKAAAAGIEARWHPFRLVKSAVYRMRAVISADLTKGLN